MLTTVIYSPNQYARVNAIPERVVSLNKFFLKPIRCYLPQMIHSYIYGQVITFVWTERSQGDGLLAGGLGGWE